MPICPRCNTDLMDGLTECPCCHQKFAFIRCNSCGSINSTKSYYCTNCGSPLFNQAKRQQPQVDYNHNSMSNSNSFKTGCLVCLLVPICVVALIFIVNLMLGVSSYMKRARNVSVDNNRFSTSNNSVVNDSFSIDSVTYTENDILIEIRDVSDRGSSWRVSYYVENNSNEEIEFRIDSFAVNGVMIENALSMFPTTLEADDDINCTFDIHKSSAELVGVNDFQTLDVMFQIEPGNDWRERYHTEVIHVSSSLDDGEAIEFNGESIYLRDSILIQYIGEYDEGYCFVVSNENDETMTLELDAVTINNYQYRNSGNVNVYAYFFGGTSYVIYINPDNDFLVDNDIEDVEEIEITFVYAPLDDMYNETSTGSLSVLID